MGEEEERGEEDAYDPIKSLVVWHNDHRNDNGLTGMDERWARS